MEAIHRHTNHAFLPTTKSSISPRKRTKNNNIDIPIKYPAPANCTETLLREYKILVELLACLDEKAFKTFYPEITATIDKLKKWFEQTATKDTLDIYWAMRCLRRKIQTS